MTATALRNANRDVANTPPSPHQDCRDVIHLMFFFDGTGNNIDADTPLKKWSNVARLSMAARNSPSLGIYRIYISGVGTRFNGDVGTARAAWTWVQDNTLGNAAGMGGDQRLDYAEEQMNANLRVALRDLAQKSNKEAKNFAQENQGLGFSELSKALAQHRLIKMINISVFGFSRGAALARAFTNQLASMLIPTDKGGHTLEGHPARLVFQGIFDTVASFGAPGENLTGPWGERDLRIPPPKLLEQCVHFVAAHELRYSFPLDLARENGQYASNVTETVYPGVHSDVGGGYEPGKQARSDALARIPLCDMLPLAVGAGVRLETLAELKKNRQLAYGRLAIPPEVQTAYAGYCREVGAASGPIEAQIQRHMALFYAARGTLHRLGRSAAPAQTEKLAAAQADAKLTQQAVEKWIRRPPRSKAETEAMTADNERYQQAQARLIAARKDSDRLGTGGDDIAAEAVALQRAIEDGSRFTATKGRLMVTLKPQPWMLEAWRRDVTPSVYEFFEQYVHDSRTDFLSGSEPFAYFNSRGVQEQTRPVNAASAKKV